MADLEKKKPIGLKIAEIKKITGDNPERRFGHSLHLIPNENKLILIGGSFTDSSFYIFDLATSKWEKKEAPFGFRYHTSCYLASSGGESYASSIIVFGGCTIGRKHVSDSFEVIKEMDTYRWEPIILEMKPEERLRHSCVASPFEPTDLYIFGGRSGIKFLNDLWQFSTKMKTWERIDYPQLDPKTIPSRRHAHSSVVFNYKMLIFGGKNIHGCVNDLWEFDFSTNLWTEILIENHNYVIPRYLSRAILIGDSNEILIGTGYYEDSQELDILSKKQMNSFAVLNYQEKKITNLITFDKSHAAKLFYDYALVQYEGNKIVMYGGDWRILPKKMRGKYQDLKSVENRAMLTFEIPEKVLTKRVVPPRPPFPAPKKKEEEEVEGEGEHD